MGAALLVGDDWLVAAGVVAMLVLSAPVAHGGYDGAAWLLTLLGVPLVVAFSIWRVVRAA